MEHTLSLIEEGWDRLNDKVPPPLAPVRMPAPTPAVLTEYEIFVRQQVDARIADEARQTAALQATVGQFSRLHHDTHNRDIRVALRKSQMPNYRPRSEWSAQEIEDLIACPPAVHQALITGDPRFKVRAVWGVGRACFLPADACPMRRSSRLQGSYRDLRPYGPDELEHLDQIGRLAPVRAAPLLLIAALHEC